MSHGSFTFKLDRQNLLHWTGS